MMKYKRIVACIISLLLTAGINVTAQNNNELPNDLKQIYPYRESQTTVKYAPWFTMVNRAESQYLQEGMNAGENCQVAGTIAFSDVNPNHVIAGFDTNGVAISTDGGENWFYSQSNVGTHACMTAFWHPTDENICYRVGNAYNGSRSRGTLLELAEYKGLLRSKDCGKTWEQVLNLNMHTEYGGTTAKFDELGNLYALTNSGLYRSSDDGDTWEQLNDMQSWVVYDLAISEDGNTILTGTVNGLNVSFDAGKTWQLRNGKQFYGNVSGVDIDPLNQKHWVAVFSRPYKCIAESYDYGKTWSLIDINMSRPFKLKFGGIQKNGKRYMYAVGYSGTVAYKFSTDNGITWRNAFVDTKNGKMNTGTQIEGLALSKKHPEIVWYAFGDGLNVSYDAGIHFYNKSAGHGGQKCFTKIVTDQEGKVHFPGTDTGYFHTETPYESGETFPACSEPYRMWGSAIAISPHNPNFMILAGGQQGDKVMYYSYDMGKNWREIVNTLSDKSYSLIEFHNKNNKIIYTNITTSFDAGKTWQLNTNTINAVSPVDSDVVLSRGAHDLSKNKTELLISKDCGKTWEDYVSITGINTKNFLVAFDKFQTEKTWVYQSNSSVLMSYNKGQLEYSYDFRDFVPKDVEITCFAQDPKDASHLLVGLSRTYMDIGHGLAESFDDGKTWTIVPGNPGNGLIEMICFEEKTNDIFVNSYCGLMIYDSGKFKEYYNVN